MNVDKATPFRIFLGQGLYAPPLAPSTNPCRRRTISRCMLLSRAVTPKCPWYVITVVCLLRDALNIFIKLS